MAKRKNSGFGSTKGFKGSFGIQGFPSIQKSIKKIPAAGVYPSNRQFGTMVQRTVIERYDAESDWVRWRKGYEYYVNASYEDLIQYNQEAGVYQQSVLETVLYDDTPYQLDIRFTGRRFSTQNSDVRNHYVMKREITNDINCLEINLGDAYSRILRDDKYATNAKGIIVQGRDGPQFDLLYESIGERFTDGRTEATLQTMLNRQKLPGIYIGKSLNINELGATYANVTETIENFKNTPLGQTIDDGLTRITVTVPASEIDANPYVQQNGVNSLIGEVVYVPEFYTIKNMPGGAEPNVDTVADFDFPNYMYFVVSDSDACSMTIANNNTALPPSVFDIAELDPIFNSTNATYDIKSGYLFNKADYQMWWNRLFEETVSIQLDATATGPEVTAAEVKHICNKISYGLLPFLINSIQYNEDFNDPSNSTYSFSSVPYKGTLKLFSIASVKSDNYAVFSDFSFTETVVDTNADGEYVHRIKGPYTTVEEQIAGGLPWSAEVWYKKINDIDPYVDPIFEFPKYPLKPATLYVCSCPSYAKTQLRMPEATEDRGRRKVNRQRRYPLPAVQGPSDYASVGLDSAAVVMASWAPEEYRLSYRICKHSIASMFDDYLKLQEPNTYQTIDAREEFGEKLAKEMKQVSDEFRAAYERGGISTLEIVFAIGQAFNYDEVAIAELVLNAKF